MDSVLRNYVLGALLAIVAVIAYVLLTKQEAVDSFMVFIVALVTYPLAVVGLYMFLEGKGHRYINGMDWSSMNDRERLNAVSYLGRYMIVSMILLSFSLVIMMNSFIIGIILLVCSIIVVVIPVIRQDTAKATAYISRGATTKVSAFLVVTAICIVPSIVLSDIGWSSDTVTVEFEENKLHVSAPMVNKYFDYDKIEELEIDPDFDKGTRIGGYGTPTICSGKFSNDVFGRYTLASYTKVQPCVFFKYDGEYFAFNQADDELTQAAYETLVQKVLRP